MAAKIEKLLKGQIRITMDEEDFKALSDMIDLVLLQDDDGLSDSLRFSETELKISKAISAFNAWLN